jgi:UDP-glucose 4-epimerase
MSRILVTGGAGFIGSHIVDEYINLGHEVWVVDNLSTGKLENVNPKARFHNLDIQDEAIIKFFEKWKFDVLNHHAAQMDVRISVNNPVFDAQTNIMGSLNLYEAAKRTNVKKIIFASSGGTVYGEQEYFPADEQHPLNPCSPYGVAKLANEKYLYYYSNVHKIESAILRYANIYGPRQNPYGEAGVVAIFINKMLKGKSPVINGDGMNTRDYVYVEDVVRANVLALEENFSGIYNIGTAAENDVNYIFRTLKAFIGAQCEEIHGEAKTGEQRRSVLSCSKIYEKAGWQPNIEFEKGLGLTVNWFKENTE